MAAREHKMLTQSRLKELLCYNPKTGDFKWRITKSNRAVKGSAADYVNNRGYHQIRLDGRLYMAHRLVWLYVHGYLPENSIDHINRIKTDNRIENLREVSIMCNLRNSNKRVDNTSGVTGVNQNVRGNRWIAVITVAKRVKYLGTFSCFSEAVAHRLAAEECCGWSSCNSQTEAYKYIQRMRGDL